MTLEHEHDRMSVEFPLTTESVVVELGGYTGRWSSEIASRYKPRLFVYEPQLWLVPRLREKLAPYPSAHVFEYGLGVQAGTFAMGEYETDGCTFLSAGRVQGVGQMREWYTEMTERGIAGIDVLMVNIEGYEFELIPHLTRQLPSVRWVMVQFHRYAGGRDNVTMMAECRAIIQRTHAVKWDYPALTCWELSPLVW